MTQQQTLNDISIKVGRLEAMQHTNTETVADMASSVQRLVDKLDKSDDIAKEAFQRVRVSEYRIKDIEDGQKWLWRTIVGAVIVGAIGLLWKGMGV